MALAHQSVEPTPWWASPWAQRITRPREDVLVPILVVIVLAFAVGRWLRWSSAQAKPAPPTADAARAATGTDPTDAGSAKRDPEGP